MELRRYVRILTKGWWIVLSAWLATLATTLVLTFTQAPVYEATATFVVSPSTDVGDNVYLNTMDILSRRESLAATYAQIAVSATVVEQALVAVGLDAGQREDFKIQSVVLPSTNIIAITVQGSDPYLARDLANAIGDRTIAYVQSLYELYELNRLDVAVADPLPVKPNKEQNLVLGGILGLGLGAALAFLAEYLRGPIEVGGQLSIIDDQTGVYTGHYFTRRLDEEISRAAHQQRPLSLMVMEVDNWSQVTQPQVRKEALKQVARLVKQNLRPQDLMARLSGGRFALLLPDVEASAAERKAEQLQTRLACNPFEPGNGRIKLNLTASFGVVDHAGRGERGQQLLDRAVEALYLAKQNGGDAVYLLSAPASEGPDDGHRAVEFAGQ